MWPKVAPFQKLPKILLNIGLLFPNIIAKKLKSALDSKTLAQSGYTRGVWILGCGRDGPIAVEDMHGYR